MSVLFPDLTNTTFPNTQDTFKTFLDVVASDGQLVGQYQAAINSGNITLANQLLQQIPAYTQKLLTAQDLNKFVDASLALERFYQSDIVPYVNTKQSEWQDIVDQFTYKGVYSSSTQYAVNNYVAFTMNDVTQLYIVVVTPPVGTFPTDTTYWRLLTIRGPRGLSGEGISFAGSWSADTAYTTQDCVSYENALWGAIANNTAQIPSEGSEYWKLLYRGTPTVYPLSATQPATQQDGDLWFKIV